ncbi:MFS transporter [Nocardioides sp. Kera G14]|uniref:MFS transporter n=1 Tax=Nocardioides sp. Kera G14 TaxID=2884264 RepID=UPI001D104469|nr:MFS transporter [Nocardioides sp. Kera G14]UDY24215.1 MFS transporter [Nocardioides sp. Kera G14]
MSRVGFATYAEVLKEPIIRRTVLLGLVIRIPLWAANIVLTLHVVTHLGRSYAEAGLVGMVVSGCLAISGPWRGRMLDRKGLRTALTPSLVVGGLVWCLAPWVGYWPLALLAGLSALFTVPSFPIIRQVLISHVPDEQRTTALSIDSVAVEVSFLIGPVLGVFAATWLPTPVALMICQLAVVAGAAALWVANPPLNSVHSDLSAGHVPVRAWLSPTACAVLAMTMICTVILAAEDLSTVAALRHWGRPTDIGWVLALWGAGSGVGGLVYGAMKRPPSAAALLILLAGSTALVALAPHQWSFVVLLTLSGAFCAPTITATVDALSRLVPASIRGEVMGWHGSALTFGSAAGAPLIGIALDQGGWAAGFGFAGLGGLAVAVLALVVSRSFAAREVVVEEETPLLLAPDPLAGPSEDVSRAELH